MGVSEYVYRFSPAASVFIIGWLMNRAGRRSIEKVLKKEV
jgi:hypothetical protein